MRQLLLSLVCLLLAIGRSAEGGVPIATYGFSTGWATFGLALPQGAVPGGSGLRIGSLPTQIDIKTTWPDGSIRFAILSARIPSAGTYAITPATLEEATSFTPAWPNVSVSFVINRATFVATLPRFTGADSWLTGPMAREARVITVPESAGTAHPLLQVVFDIRSYADGDHRVDVTVQNVKDVEHGDAAAYDVTIAVDDMEIFAQRGVLHSYLTRWRRTFQVGQTAEAHITPDLEPFHQARAIPRFRSDIADAQYAISGSRYGVLEFGDFQPDMQSAGGRPEIGWLPDWIVRYLVFKTKATWAYMIRHAELSGSWSGHITEPDGVSLITLSNGPEYWLDGRADRGRRRGPSAPRIDGRIRGATQWLRPSHLPSPSFVPYLLTGDRFHLDQQRFWAAFVLLKTWPGPTGIPAAGLDYSRGPGLLLENGIRGTAWSLRAIGEMLAYMPDDTVDRPYFAAKLQLNLDWLDAHARSFDSGPLESVLWQMHLQERSGQTFFTAQPWQHAYLAYALHRLSEHGFASATALRDRIVRSHLRLFASAPEYPRTHAAPYELVYGVATRQGPWQPFTTMRQVYDATYGEQRAPTPFAGWYAPEARTMLQLARWMRLPGADAALEWLDSQPDVLTDLRTRPRFAVEIAADE